VSKDFLLVRQGLATFAPEDAYREALAARHGGKTLALRLGEAQRAISRIEHEMEALGRCLSHVISCPFGLEACSDPDHATAWEIVKAREAGISRKEEAW
jgi:hypothetical protein